MSVPPVERTTPTTPVRKAAAPDHSPGKLPPDQRAQSKDNYSSLRSVFDIYNVGWVRSDDGTDFVIRTHPIDIEAPIDLVWEVVKDVEHYKRLSSGAIRAHVDGDVAVGKEISMQIFPKQCVGKIMGTSVETISIVDDARKIVGWTRHLPLSGDTERYHILEAIGPHTTRSYIALKMPGLLGGVSALLFGTTIRKAFKALHHGIKLHSERLTEG